jgi:hypothetical protein
MDPELPPPRRWRVPLLVALALVVGWPALQPHPADGFPISSYPMFSTDRGRRVALTTAVGVSDDGRELRLGSAALGGGDQTMLAVSTVQRAVGGGPASALAFCEDVAARVDDPDVIEVRVQTERRDSLDDVLARDPARSVDVHARCAAP